jgi:hypothetical protein
MQPEIPGRVKNCPMAYFPVLRNLLVVTLFLPFMTRGQDLTSTQTSYGREGDRSDIRGSLPLNEISIHAFRHFHKHFSLVTGESWFKTEEGYLVSFIQHSIHHRAYFDSRGDFLYSLQYYTGAAISRELVEEVEKKYPDYHIAVVTEISDGEMTFYVLKIENSSSVKTLSLCEGKMEIMEDLYNANGPE